MADPVTLAMIGATAGAVTNKKDPLKGALLGATLGYGGGALAPGLLGTGAAAPAAGLAGITPMGVEAAGGLLGSTAPVASPGVGAVLSTGTQAAAPSMMSRLATPQTLMAGAQLAGSMSPPPQRAQPLPLRPGQPSQVIMPEISIVQSPLLPGQRQLQYPGIMQTQLRPGQSEVLLNYFPVERFQ